MQNSGMSALNQLRKTRFRASIVNLSALIDSDEFDTSDIKGASLQKQRLTRLKVKHYIAYKVA